MICSRVLFVQFLLRLLIVIVPGFLGNPLTVQGQTVIISWKQACIGLGQFRTSVQKEELPIMSEITKTIHTSPTWNGYTFDPGRLILAVNTLRSLNKAEVLSGFIEYRQLLSKLPGDRLMNTTRIFLLLRVLFEPDDSTTHFPRINIGSTDDTKELSPTTWPIYPLVLIKDVPLLIAPEFSLTGKAQDPLEHIEFVEKRCHLRKHPLAPPDNPLNLSDELIVSKRWRRPESWQSRDQALLRAQLLRLVRSVYVIPGVDEPDFFAHLQSGTMNEELWQGCMQIFANLKATWDPETNSYKVR